MMDYQYKEDGRRSGIPRCLLLATLCIATFSGADSLLADGQLSQSEFAPDAQHKAAVALCSCTGCIDTKASGRSHGVASCRGGCGSRKTSCASCRGRGCGHGSCYARSMGVIGPLGVIGRLRFGCPCGRGCGLCGFGSGLFGTHQGTPPGDMMGHMPYQALQMYYYYRPYQMSQVEDLQVESVRSEPNSPNVWDNRLFERVGDEYAHRFRNVATTDFEAAQNLEFVGRPDPAIQQTLPHTGQAAAEFAPLDAEDGTDAEDFFDSRSFDRQFPRSPSDRYPSDRFPNEYEPEVVDSEVRDDLADLRLIDPAVKPPSPAVIDIR